jgi:hypothetical protein
MSEPQFPDRESGYFHLTPAGWTRKDAGHPPPDRLETWKYELERPSRDAKDEVRLTKIWMSEDLTAARSAALHTQYGEAVEPTHERNVILDCHV